MSIYVVKTLPRSAKLERVVWLSDLTEYVLETNDANMAKSSVDGSLRPTAAFRVGDEGTASFSNLSRTNGAGIRKGDFSFIVGPTKKRGFTPPNGPARPGRARFDSSKKDDKPKREAIIEHV